MSFLKTFTKNQQDILDYEFDFTDWLTKRGQDTIISYEGDVSTGLTKYNVTGDAYSVKVFAGGGFPGETYEVTCTINTLGGRRKTAKVRVYITQ